MASNNINQQEIQNKIVDAAAEDIDAFFSQDVTLSSLLQKIEFLLKQIVRVEQKWSAAREKQQALTIKAGLEKISSQTALSYATLSLYNQKQNILQREEILRVISESEIFLDRLRKLLTGKEIVYTLGFSYYSEVFEQRVDIMHMLKNSAIGFESDTQGLKLRIQNKKSELLKAYNQLREEQKISQLVGEGFDVFRKWYFSQKSERGGRILFNLEKITSQGELYEAYIYLKKIGELKTILESIEKGFFTDKASNIFIEAIKRSKNSTSGRRGGDVDDTQVKWYGASFASISEIKNTLNKVQKALIQFQKSNKKLELREALKDIFTKDPNKTIEKIEEKAQEEARKNINSFVKDLKL